MFCDVTSWQHKVESGCTTGNLSLSKGIKIVSVLHAFKVKSCEQILSFTTGGFTGGENGDDCLPVEKWGEILNGGLLMM